MRDAQAPLWREMSDPTGRMRFHVWRKQISHAGLGYEVLSPWLIGDETRKEEEAAERDSWLSDLEKTRIPDHYQMAYEQWQESFRHDGSRAFEATLCARLLLGHGNESPSGVGMTFHHTWGTPLIPGSAIKGLLSHYIQIKYGPKHPETHPEDPAHPDPERAPYQGVTWKDSRIAHGPGLIYKMLFGAPPADSDDEYYGPDQRQQKGESQGFVVFHDAMMILDDHAKQPFARDVLTVHHKPYYDKGGGSWPNDYEDPTPVSFLSVKPGIRFTFAMSGPQTLTRLASQLLKEALQEWGIGGKTSLGYGRFRDCKDTISLDLNQKAEAEQEAQRQAEARAAEAAKAKEEALDGELYNRFSDWLINNPEELGKRKQLEAIMDEWLEELQVGTEQERALLWRLISGNIKSNKKTKTALQELKQALVGD